MLKVMAGIGVPLTVCTLVYGDDLKLKVENEFLSGMDRNRAMHQLDRAGECKINIRIDGYLHRVSGIINEDGPRLIVQPAGEKSYDLHLKTKTIESDQRYYPRQLGQYSQWSNTQEVDAMLRAATKGFLECETSDEAESLVAQTSKEIDHLVQNVGLNK